MGLMASLWAGPVASQARRAGFPVRARFEPGMRGPEASDSGRERGEGAEADEWVPLSGPSSTSRHRAARLTGSEGGHDEES